MLVLGIFLGKEIFSTSGDIPVFSNQLNSVLDQIEYLYVDTVDRRSLEEAAVEAIVNELDPHSVYFDAEEVQAMAEPMEGGFEGIGVEFLITNDTLMVVTAYGSSFFAKSCNINSYGDNPIDRRILSSL